MASPSGTFLDVPGCPETRSDDGYESHPLASQSIRNVPARVIDAWAEQLRQWLIADSRLPKRGRRTATQMYEELRATDYDGSYRRVCAFVRIWKQERDESPQHGAFVPMSFEYGDAFQFDWNCEYVFIWGLRRRLEVANVKLAASRAFWLVGTTTK